MKRCLLLIVFALSIPLSAKEVVLLKLNGVINPITARYLIRNIDRASTEHAEAVVIELSTPGGLLDATRSIIEKFLESPVPIIVYIYPQGTHAASAGTFITLAAHIAAMAPATNIGSAHPVAGGGQQLGKSMEEKVVNDTVALIKNVARRRGRNVRWAEKAVRKSVAITPEAAVKQKVVNFIAKDLDELLQKADGQTVELPSGEKKLELKKASLRERPMNWADDILNMVAHPNIAYILMMLGVYAWIYEFAAPGIGLGAVFGTISLLLAFFALQVLPINWTGLFLMLAGLAFLLLELKAHSGGILSIGGLTAFIFGSFMLFDSSSSPYARLSPSLVFIASGTTAGFVFVALQAILRTYRKKSIVGVEVLQQSEGVVETDFHNGKGLILVEGELWKAVSEEPLRKNDPVRVVAKEGHMLRVTKT